MALKEPKGGTSREMPERRSIVDDATALIDTIRENPLIAVAAVGCLILIIGVGVLFVVSSKVAVMEANTDLAAAINNEDPALRAEALETVAQTRKRNDAMALYLAAESAVRAQKYAEARENFQGLLEEHPKSEYAARAAEGLAFLTENDGEFEAALEAYRGVIEQYPESLTAKTLYRRIGQLLEKMERPKDAIDAYMEQFRVFPKGRVTVSAMSDIRRLSDSADPEVAEAADAAFRTLSEESPAFEEQFPFYYVEPEEPAEDVPADDTPLPLANTDELAPAANTEAMAPAADEEVVEEAAE